MIATLADPFMRAIRDNGSVAILASSRKTIGKSISLVLKELADKSVEQT